MCNRCVSSGTSPSLLPLQCRYLNVTKANLSDGWDTEPFTLTEGPNGQLIGRGSSDDKGPVLGWLNTLQYHFENKKELPVNFRCCFEGMEESGSEGLDELVERESKSGGWFDGVDCVCIVGGFSYIMCTLSDDYLDSLTTTGSIRAPRFSLTVFAVYLTSSSTSLGLQETCIPAYLVVLCTSQ